MLKSVVWSVSVLWGRWARNWEH